MKFWKSLSNLIEETLPDWRDKFLSYKDLKKQLKRIYPVHEGDPKRPSKRPKLGGESVGDGTVIAGESAECSGAGEDGMTKEVIDFGRLLEDEVDKFNGFFVEKEEEYVIHWKELQDRVEKAKVSNDELIKVWREIVDFHGEMVLLENYSALNYTGLVKILKKYDKRSGALIRLPFIQRLLKQPFYTTDLLDKLVGECEATLDRLLSMSEPPTPSPAGGGGAEAKGAAENKERPLVRVPEGLAEIERMESVYTKLALSALRVLKEIRSGSSTVSVFSLPPLESDGGRGRKLVENVK